MYQGKHVTRKTRRRRSAKPFVLLASVAIILCTVVGGTLAWLTDAQEVNNTFTPGKVSCEINESFDGEVKSGVTIKNTGNVDAKIRAQVVVSWQDAKGNTFGLPTDGYYTLDISSDWSGSNPYVYNGTVAPGASTSALIVSCTRTGKPAGLPEGFDLSVEILADAIQAEGGAGWGYKPAK